MTNAPKTLRATLPGEDSVIRKTAMETRIIVRRSIRIRLTINFAMIYLALVDDGSRAQSHSYREILIVRGSGE